MTAQLAAPTHFARRLKVFLCHALGDKPAVRDLYHRLCGAGFDPWLDEENLLPGQDWQLEIPKAVRSSEAVVICLSRRAVTKAGYVQKEIRYALDVADEQPEGAIFLIPVRLEACEVPQRLRRWQWVDLFQEDGCDRLLRALRARASSLGLPAHPFEPEMILVPAGEFLMGGDPANDQYVEGSELPQHRLYLPDYYLARTPVTNAQYAAFIQARDHQLQPETIASRDYSNLSEELAAYWEALVHQWPLHWNRGKPPKGKDDHPMAAVSFYEARDYCRWLSQVTGRNYSLPSEAEWEKGARGTDGRSYPWGDNWESERCNTVEAGTGDTTPVGAYPEGASPYGLLDMAGNVWEWTRSLWGTNAMVPHFTYPYDPQDGRENQEVHTKVMRVTRGGAWTDERWNALSTFRFRCAPRCHTSDVGFRVCIPSRQD